jgi:chromosome segregation ATPase
MFLIYYCYNFRNKNNSNEVCMTVSSKLEHPRNPLLQGFQALSSAGRYAVRLVSFPIDIFHLFNGRFFKPEQIYRALSSASIAISAIGAGGTAISFVSFILGFPSAIVWTGLLTVTAAAGAFTADKAARYYTQANNMEELKELLEERGRQNQEFGRQITLLTTQNETLKATAGRFETENANLNEDVTRLTDQNNILTTNVDSLTTQVADLKESMAQFALHNESYRTIAERIETYVEQSRTGNVQNQAELTLRLEEMTQQVAASKMLWDQVSQDHATQMAQVKELVAQLADPVNTLLQLQQYQALNRQIQTATEKLADLKTQIALREGQVKERDQLLTELRNAHNGILESYGQQNAILGQRKEALEAQVNRFSNLLNSPSAHRLGDRVQGINLQ